jgi:hypothetical protein
MKEIMSYGNNNMGTVYDVERTFEISRTNMRR